MHWPRLGHEAEVSASASFRHSAFRLGLQGISFGSPGLDVKLFAKADVLAKRLASRPLASAWPRGRIFGHSLGLVTMAPALASKFSLGSLGLGLATTWPRGRSFGLSLGL